MPQQVETAGDCYIVSGGIMSPDPSNSGFGVVMEDHNPAESARRVMNFAKALLEAAKEVRSCQYPILAVFHALWRAAISILLCVTV